MKKVIRLTESDLHNIVKESVKRVLNEGLTPVFKQIAKRHGGVKWVDKKYQFDKLPFGNYDWDEFIELYPGKDIPWTLQRKFVDRVMDFNDGGSLYVLKPEYHNNQKIKDMLKSSEELSAQRSADFQPGTERGEIEVDYGGGPATKSYTRTLSPEAMRQKAHKAARGKTPLEGAAKNDAFRKEHGISRSGDYDEYVKNYLCDKFNGVYLDGYIAIPVSDRWGEDAERIRDEFRRYGYGEDESINNEQIQYDLEYDDSGYNFDPNSDYMTFTKGNSRSFFEGDDGEPYGWYTSNKMKPTPKIGTTDFMK